MKISKIFIFIALITSLSSQALAKDYIHQWCAPNETVAEPAFISTPQVEHINLSADALFKFNRHSSQDMLPQGKTTLDELANNLMERQASIDSIALIGHTDRLGSERYNYELGLKRAETVRDYLQEKGVRSPISIRSSGESQPITTDCVGEKNTAALQACLQPDRRVTVEIMGTVPAR